MMPDTLHDVDARVDPQGVVLLVPEEEAVPESTAHERLVDLIHAGMAARFSDIDDVAVHCRLAWFPDRGDTRVRLDPDVMVIIGRPQQERKSYRAWAEDHVAPALFVEVVSEDDTNRRYRDRLERARKYGVTEIVLISPFTAGGVRIEHLVADTQVPSGWRIAATTTNPDSPIMIDTIGVTFAGGPEMVVSDETGIWHDTPTLHRLARQAETEAQRADTEAQRADRLAAALRDAGIDPDDL